ncbi:hypothetical protein CRUP_035966 [Coryphaenoides rupestris]|nr:hypothetical protein CRUP_035966 [Coryphaenoides rupestris]
MVQHVCLSVIGRLQPPPYSPQYIPGRCVCPKTVKYTSENITDFQIIEPGPSCSSMQVIVTLWTADNSTNMLCLDPARRLAMAFINCWKKINREESKKVTCLNKRKNKSQ